jgi:6-pyruvoyltetrahydropterin/6-carboxytetrahydropterin synthase
MLELTRAVRFCISFADSGLEPVKDARHNTFAAWPSLSDIGIYYELLVTCRGSADPAIGYLMNIARIDDAVRQHAIPVVRRAVLSGRPCCPGLVLADVVAALQPSLKGSLQSIEWKVTPFYSIAVESDAMDRFTMSQVFEFAAAHRLHCPDLTDEENRQIFGKCNNANGHGHNYHLEVSVAVPMPAEGGIGRFRLPDLERIVHETVIERFDHTHLNLDTTEFAELNPSIENITRVCHDLLAAPLAAAGATLECVRAWETEKTSCTYPSRRRRR